MKELVYYFILNGMASWKWLFSYRVGFSINSRNFHYCPKLSLLSYRIESSISSPNYAHSNISMYWLLIPSVIVTFSWSWQIFPSIPFYMTNICSFSCCPLLNSEIQIFDTYVWRISLKPTTSVKIIWLTLIHIKMKNWNQKWWFTGHFFKDFSPWGIIGRIQS